MNEVFKEAVTNTAFCIQLSKRQCHELLRLESMTEDEFKSANNHWNILSVGTMRGLEAKGLFAWKPQMGLTEAGKLMAGLLKEAA